VNYVKSNQVREISTANTKTLYSLSQEFDLFDLSSPCGQLLSDIQIVDSPLMSAGAGFNTNCLSQTKQFETFRRDFPFCLSDSLFTRLEQVEREVANFSGHFENRLTICVSNCEELHCTMSLEDLRLESRLERDLSDLKLTCDRFRSEIDELITIPRLFPLHAEDPLNGIICDLTRKHGGSLHGKGIVLMTSKSENEGDVKNLVDIASDSAFGSDDEPGQWVCWEFQDSYIRPTHFTIPSFE
jgi:hypothetical protein